MLLLPFSMMVPVFIGEQQAVTSRNSTTFVTFFFILLAGDTVDYRCALAPNSTLNEWILQHCNNDDDVTDARTCEYDKCRMYSEAGNYNDTTECQHGYWFDPESGYESTQVTEV